MMKRTLITVLLAVGMVAALGGCRRTGDAEAPREAGADIVVPPSVPEARAQTPGALDKATLAVQEAIGEETTTVVPQEVEPADEPTAEPTDTQDQGEDAGPSPDELP